MTETSNHTSAADVDGEAVVIDLAARRRRPVTLPPVAELLRQAGLPVPFDDAGRRAETSARIEDAPRAPVGLPPVDGPERVEDTPRVLPSRGVVAYQVHRARRLMAHHAKRHGARLPLYGGRLLLASGRGAGRTLRVAAVWAAARDHTEVVRAELDPKARLEHKAARRDARVKRAGLVAGGMLAAGGGLAVAWFMLPPLILSGVITALISALAAAGRRPVDVRQGAVLDAPRVVGVVDSTAIVAASRAAGFGQVRVVGPIARDDSGLVPATVALVELPPGGVAARAAARTAELASALDGAMSPDQIAIDPVRGAAGRFSLWVADVDPYGVDVRAPASPFLTAERTDFWSPLPVAYTPRGRVVSIDMGAEFAGLMLAGEPGGGKSAAANTLLAGVVLDPSVELIIADGKGLDSRDWWPLATSVSTADPAGLAEQLGELIARHEQRTRFLATIGARKVTKELAGRYPAELHPVLLYVDELAFYVQGKTGASWNLTGEPLRMLVSLCRATGIRVLTATQKPQDDVVPSKLRDMYSGRWALRCTTPQMSDVALGAGWAKRGADASQIDASQRGVGYLKDETGAPVRCRSHFLSDGQVADIAQRAAKLRKAAGTLPVSEWPPRLLVDALTACGSERNIHTVDLLAALERAGHKIETPDQLAEQLRPYGLRPVDVWANGATRKGYKRAELAAAIDTGPRRGRT
jgi:hypothetical protein